jgi:hypothetical protein
LRIDFVDTSLLVRTILPRIFIIPNIGIETGSTPPLTGRENKTPLLKG